MGLLSELTDSVAKTFKDQWSSRDASVVPTPESLQLGNDTARLDRATILYADLSGSTKMVDGYPWFVAAEIYKSFLHCAAKLIRSEGGEITSYDGDRVMGVFIGKSQSNSAARCALKINWAVQMIVAPALEKQYPDKGYSVQQVVGIDTSEIRAARTGVRGDNDIVWVGRAANYAAKLTAIDGHRTLITGEVFDQLHNDVKLGGEKKENMWQELRWTAMKDKRIYASSWRWTVS